MHKLNGSFNCPHGRPILIGIGNFAKISETIRKKKVYKLWLNNLNHESLYKGFAWDLTFSFFFLFFLCFFEASYGNSS